MYVCIHVHACTYVGSAIGNLNLSCFVDAVLRHPVPSVPSNTEPGSRLTGKRCKTEASKLPSLYRGYWVWCSTILIYLPSFPSSPQAENLSGRSEGSGRLSIALPESLGIFHLGFAVRISRSLLSQLPAVLLKAWTDGRHIQRRAQLLAMGQF